MKKKMLGMDEKLETAGLYVVGFIGGASRPRTENFSSAIAVTNARRRDTAKA
jgi:hypothetical protein